MSFIKCELHHLVATITFSNPAKRNALSHELLTELTDTFNELAHTNVRVVILRAHENIKVWSAGHDIDELSGPGHDPLAEDSPLQKALHALRTFRAPVIAMIQGSVWGGACDLVMNCDIVIGDPSCSFAMTPTKIGLPYNLIGISQFVERIGINFAKEMFFTGLPVSAEKAAHIGLLNHLIPTETLVEFTYNMAATITERAPQSIAIVKEQVALLNHIHSIDEEQIQNIETKRQQILQGYDYTEGIRAFHEKRKPKFRG